MREGLATPREVTDVWFQFVMDSLVLLQRRELGKALSANVARQQLEKQNGIILNPIRIRKFTNSFWGRSTSTYQMYGLFSIWVRSCSLRSSFVVKL